MLDTVHAAAILLYGPMAGYALLAVIAAPHAIRRRPLPGWFWTLSLAGVILVTIQGAAGTLLVLGGARPRQSLHLLYGLLVLAGGGARQRRPPPPPPPSGGRAGGACG